MNTSWFACLRYAFFTDRNVIFSTSTPPQNTNTQMSASAPSAMAPTLQETRHIEQERRRRVRQEYLARVMLEAAKQAREQIAQDLEERERAKRPLWKPAASEHTSLLSDC